MKSFKLQSVLEYRELVKDLAQQELSKTLQKEAVLIDDINQTKEELDNLYKDLKNRQHHGITPHELLLFENHCSYKERVIKSLKEKLVNIRNKITEQRQALCAADRDRKLLENLKKKQADEYTRLLQKKETNETDEIAVQIHGR